MVGKHLNQSKSRFTQIFVGLLLLVGPISDSQAL